MDAELGRGILGNAAEAARREWLVTNGLGGYAAGTLSGELTRRYHGWLVAALQPPVRRTLVLAKFAERLRVRGEAVDLDTNRWVGGALAPAGHVHLESFWLEGTVPCWRWMVGPTRLERRIGMDAGHNTTWIEYTLVDSDADVELELRPLVDARDHHETTRGGEGFASAVGEGALHVRSLGGSVALTIDAGDAHGDATGVWYRDFALGVESERGLDDVTDYWCAGTLTHRLEPGERWCVRASVEAAPHAVPHARERRGQGDAERLADFDRTHGRAARGAPAWIRRLVLSADAFIVQRAYEGDAHGRSVIAGYPWFSDWGRDTMIALPGLTITTGRPAVARSVLTQFARHVSGGMLPNYWPDDGAPAEYNTVDAALWFFQAVEAYVQATDDDALLAALRPALGAVIEGYEQGTRHGIAVDPGDGLVTQGEDGLALTWMDARVDGWVVTPRRGKPVEINALWYGALRAMERFAKRLGEPTSPWTERAERVRASFARYWHPERGGLFDVLDGPDGPDPTVRPNQIFAVSLPDPLLAPERARAVVDLVGRTLLTPHGLRSLAPSEPGYVGVFRGDRFTRDGAYHQGTVWTWLLPPYALAHFRVHGDRAAALALLEPLADLTRSMCIGQLPEVADGDPPQVPRGCFAQAWSVAEALRVWHALVTAKPPRARRTRATTQ